MWKLHPHPQAVLSRSIGRPRWPSKSDRSEPLPTCTWRCLHSNSQTYRVHDLSAVFKDTCGPTAHRAVLFRQRIVTVLWPRTDSVSRCPEAELMLLAALRSQPLALPPPDHSGEPKSEVR